MNLHAIYLPLSGKYGAYHFLFMSNKHDVINIVDQYDVLWDVKVIRFPEDYR